MCCHLRFAKFWLQHSKTKSFSLLEGLLAYFRSTNGPGQRKAYLPSRLVKQKKKKMPVKQNSKKKGGKTKA